ncbi:MAG: pseudouridine synthase [Candidatus Woesearchaeota archaeon]
MALQRVQKIIANSGYCSRRRAEQLILEGRVSVNGKRCQLGDKADAFVDRIMVDGRELAHERKTYILFYKPKFVLCSMEKTPGRKSIADFVRVKERVYPAGRLDFDSEGLVLLTNDGEITNLITHPRYETEKEYLVWIDRPIKSKDLKLLRQGVDFNGSKSWPLKAETLEDSKAVRIIMHEGKKHQIKKMFEVLGYKVVRLLRVRIGSLSINGLAPGRYRKLSFPEIKLMFRKLQRR